MYLVSIESFATFASLEDRIRQAVDYYNPVVRSFAVNAIARENAGPYNIGQICDIWEAIYNRWVYVNDPIGFFDFTPASHTVAHYNFRGDCDDFAVLVAACIKAIGGTVRIRVEYDRSRRASHAYALVFLGRTYKNAQTLLNYIYNRYIIAQYSIEEWTQLILKQLRAMAKNQPVTQEKTGLGTAWYLKDSQGIWLNLDWQAPYPGGPFWAEREEIEVVADVIF